MALVGIFLTFAFLKFDHNQNLIAPSALSLYFFTKKYPYLDHCRKNPEIL